jgi:hypothetical protein
VNRIVVRYKVKPDQVARNEELVRAVYEELARVQPAGLRYATLRLDDGLTFLHIASNETGSEKSPLRAIGAFREFQEGINARCDEAPVAIKATEIGSYRLFDSVDDVASNG